MALIFPTGRKLLTDEDGKKGAYFEDDGGKKYRYIQNKHSATTAAGDFAGYDFATASNAGYQVKQPATANLDRMAGIWAEAVATSAWGMLQVKGYTATATLNSCAGAITAGDSLKGANGSSYAVSDQAAGTEPTYARRAYALAASTGVAADTIAVYIDCD